MNRTLGQHLLVSTGRLGFLGVPCRQGSRNAGGKFVNVCQEQSGEIAGSGYLVRGRIVVLVQRVVSKKTNVVQHGDQSFRDCISCFQTSYTGIQVATFLDALILQRTFNCLAVDSTSRTDVSGDEDIFGLNKRRSDVVGELLDNRRRGWRWMNALNYIVLMKLPRFDVVRLSEVSSRRRSQDNTVPCRQWLQTPNIDPVGRICTFLPRKNDA